MTKGLTIAVLVGATLFGVAGAANAQDYRHEGYRYQQSRVGNRDYTSGQRLWMYMNSADGTAEHGNATPPAGGIGRVNSHTQE
jgi:hypothetical protein